ncbi:MAG: molybdopterin-dependent oxidoreductase, partial [Eggerthellaceae bacterium]|nr:molybdopterin-dependent oxidoreductase [Eggerthellaceae bacterium]
MALTTMSRRSFLKTAAVVGAVSALGVEAAANFEPSDKAWAEDETIEVRTSCRACIANCGVIATVSNGRVIKIRGDEIDPMSQGRICPKGISGVQALYHPNRNKYPMVRVGDKPGNEWERVTWDEACQIVAQAMIDMRDKTGKHGLLTTTGGGGNPQFFSPPRFRNFWGAGNVFEPGCAQCYLPRNYTMPNVNGVSDTSIADSGCSELYKPVEYGNIAEVYVMWGTGPAWHSPSTSGRCVTELRANGTKTIVVDPRFNADASKADIWLPIKPGTDMAMMLGWMNYIIENDLYEKIPDYEDFCEQWTNLPFLVDPRDEVSLPPVAEDITTDGQLLRASEVFEDCDETNEGYVYYDTKTKQVTKAFALGPDNEGTYNPQLFGTVDVTLKDGSTITCKTAFQAYKDRCADFDLDTVAEITGCDADAIADAVELYCSSAHGGISLGVATDMYPGSTQAAIGAAALDCMTAHLYHTGCPANSVGGQGSSGRSSAESTIFPPGFGGGGDGYEFQTNDAVLERLGYCEHKGLGGWMHSHIPTVLSAVLTGEPYQPKVWIERSGNKMVALGNSSSWVDAFPKFDLIVHGYMYPTSFTTEAADVVFPICEWLENSFIQNRLNVNLLRQPVTNLFEAADEIMMWGMIAEAMSHKGTDLYDENMEACLDADIINSPMVSPYWTTINDYWDWVAQQCGDSSVTSMEEAKAIMPFETATADEYWGGTTYDKYLTIASSGGGMGGGGGAPAAEEDPDAPQTYTGFSTTAGAIV